VSAVPAPAAPPPTATRRSPRTPYPGLRPFLDYEDMLMYGRSQQVRDIVQRLGRGAHAGDAMQGAADGAGGVDSAAGEHTEPPLPLTRFVAVIGGSGSGKSSLIRAGVVPFLRQFGIPEVGDLWRAIVFTPGTNFASAAETPVTRLARKFESQLAGERSEDRVMSIAGLLRRPGGLSRVVDVYGPEFAVAANVRAEHACVLVVIDQFEELFHRSNAEVADARELIERVIDHFHQARHSEGSPRCFLAITMRSEHLNDCAAWIGLPEAINAGAYLVSRLDEEGLREVIRRPAERFLRLRQRERRDDRTLPPTIAFDDALVALLVKHTLEIAHDPDHLPLLQHALARVWQRACEREQVAEGGVPAQLLLSDLDCPSFDDDAPAPLQPNPLRANLDRWAQRSFRSHGADEQAQLTALLRELAYRDPVAGTYNQQRVYVADWPQGADALRAMLEGRWIRLVHYLHWDDDDPARVTLKVSHESFIRGWRHFRSIVDDEALRTERFAALMAACSDWVQGGRREQDLLDSRMLGRFEDARVGDALGSLAAGARDDPAPPAWRPFQSALARMPQHAALQQVPLADARDYLRLSIAHLEQEKRQARRQVKRLAWFGAAAVLGVAGLLFAVFVLVPVVDRSRDLFNAAAMADQATLKQQWPEVGGGRSELSALIDAALLFGHAQTGEQTPAAGISDLMLHRPLSPLAWSSLSNVLPVALRSVEPRINGILRATLTRSLWYADPRPPADPRRIVDAEAERPIQGIDCDGYTGTLVLAEGSRSQAAVRRGVFISRLPDRDPGPTAQGSAGPGSGEPPDRRSRLLFSATLKQAAEGEGSGCSLGREIFSMPQDQNPVAMFDALISHMLQLSNGNGRDAPQTLTVSRLAWESSDGDRGADLLPPQTVLLSDEAGNALRRQLQAGARSGADEAIGMAQATWRMPAGRALLVDGQAWRIVSEHAQRIEPMPPRDQLVELPDASGDPRCLALLSLDQFKTAGDGDPATAQPPRVYADGGYCLIVTAAATSAAEDAVQRRQIFVRAYLRPRSEDLDDRQQLKQALASVASVEFGNLSAPADGKGWVWLGGTPGSPQQGWLMLRRPADTYSPERLVGVPWSTPALLKLAQDVLKEHEAHVPKALPPVPPSAAKGG
jgi:hypothetical protein